MIIYKDKHGRLRCIVELPGDNKSKLYLYGDKRKGEKEQLEEIALALMSRNLLWSKAF